MTMNIIMNIIMNIVMNIFVVITKWTIAMNIEVDYREKYSHKVRTKRDSFGTVQCELSKVACMNALFCLCSMQCSNILEWSLCFIDRELLMKNLVLWWCFHWAVAISWRNPLKTTSVISTLWFAISLSSATFKLSMLFQRHKIIVSFWVQILARICKS